MMTATSITPAFDAVVLAGGLSSRMGQDKSFLTFNQLSLLERQTQLLHKVGAQQVLISRNDGQLDSLPDVYPHQGPLSGIHSALKKALHGLLVIPVDMPLLNVHLLLNLVEKGQQFETPSCYANHVLPLYIPKIGSTFECIERTLRRKENPSIKRLLTTTGFQQLPLEDAHAFVNVNSPTDWSATKPLLVKQTIAA